MSESSLEARLGYTFSDPTRLDEALTHSTFRNEQPDVDVDNERLEFLGDAVVGLMVAGLLCSEKGAASEGEMSTTRAQLVCRGALAKLGAKLGLGAAMKLGVGQQKSGAQKSERILANAFEAVVGAVFLDSGYQSCEKVFLGYFKEFREASRSAPQKDAKTELQEWAQSQGNEIRYELVDEKGPAHKPEFFVRVWVGEHQFQTQCGRSKKLAEQAAAAAALNARLEGHEI